MSVIWPLQMAIDAAILGDAVLAAKLGGEKVYSQLAPEEDSALPYVLLSQSAESRLPIFERRGFANTESLSVWSADTTKKEAADLCDDLVRLLDHTTLALPGYNFITGELTILAIALDPSGRYTRANLSYAVLSHG